MKFSERYGYVKPSEVIITERITEEIQNAICTCYDKLYIKIDSFKKYNLYQDFGLESTRSLDFLLEEFIWCHFLNKRKSLYDNYSVITPYILKDTNLWYKKLDLIEESLSFLNKYSPRAADELIYLLNNEFERLNFGYRIVNNEIVSITDEQQIQSIESAMGNSKDNVKMHLNEALKLYSQRPTPDYRNSIKESISAVEAFSREITGDKGLNLGKMESAGINIPSVLKSSFNILYGYTNNPSTGIRHALMDETAEYLPGADEALFMLVSCSAFINYLNGKRV